MVSTGVKTRILLLAVLFIAFISVLILGSHREPPGGFQPAPIAPGRQSSSNQNGASLTGHAIAPKLGNETAKYVVYEQTCAHALPGRDTTISG
jgi:hypothetical protein